jgi:hypothetical protein
MAQLRQVGTFSLAFVYFLFSDQDECLRGCWFVTACGGFGTATGVRV